MKKINELLHKLRPDTDTTRTNRSVYGTSSLEHVFPKIKWVYFLSGRDVEFSYKRLNPEEFEVDETLYDRNKEDFDPIINNTEMLLTIKHALKDGDYTLKVQGNDLILSEVTND